MSPDHWVVTKSCNGSAESGLTSSPVISCLSDFLTFIFPAQKLHVMALLQNAPRLCLVTPVLCCLSLIVLSQCVSRLHAAVAPLMLFSTPLDAQHALGSAPSTCCPSSMAPWWVMLPKICGRSFGVMTRDCDAATREEALVKIWLRCFTLLPGTSKQSWGQQCSGATLMCFDLDCCHVGRQKTFSYEKKI